MGGIAGILNAEKGRGDAALLEAMLLSIAHRGPDDTGLVQDDRAALGHVGRKRNAARQPLASSDRSNWIVFDGQLLNAPELASELKRCGRDLAGADDAQLVLEAYRIFGEDCVRHLDGAWAFAIWDGRNQALFASRDRWGARPFFYTTAGRELVFASEIKALVRHPGVDRRVDPIALDQVFTLHSTIPPRTILANVFELPSGHSLYWSDGALRVFRHWQLDFGAPRFAGDECEAQEQLLALITESTRRWLAGCETPGVLADSLAGRLIAESTRRCGGVDFVGIREPHVALPKSYDASCENAPPPGAAACSPRELAGLFAEIVRHAEAPLLDFEAVPVFLAARTAREQGCSLLVSAAGAHALLGGSQVFGEAAIRRFWGRQVDSKYRPALLKRLYPDLPWQASQPLPYWQAYFHIRADELSNPLFSHLARWGQTARLKKYFSADLRAEIGDYDAHEEARLRLPAGFKLWDPLSQAQFLEAAWPLSGRVLSSQIDRLTMAHGVEAALPFLERRVAEFAASLPAHLKLRGTRGPVLLKRLAGRMLSATASSEPTATRVPEARGGHNPPGDAAASLVGAPQALLRDDELNTVLSRERIAEAGLFDPVGVSRLLRKARSAEPTASQTALLGILSTQLLVAELLGGCRLPSASGPSSVRCESATTSRN